jgi:hypothetical protein
LELGRRACSLSSLSVSCRRSLAPRGNCAATEPRGTSHSELQISLGILITGTCSSTQPPPVEPKCINISRTTTFLNTDPLKTETTRGIALT